jgi:YVTN family beta-propeller protein
VLAPSSARLYVSCRESGVVAVIDVSRLALARVIKVGRQPAPVTVVPGGQRLLVPLGGEDVVAVVDPARGRVTKRIPVGPEPITAVLAPGGGQALVPDTGGRTVTVLSLARMRAASTWRTGRSPRYVLPLAAPLVVTEGGQVSVFRRAADLRGTARHAPPERGGADPRRDH